MSTPTNSFLYFWGFVRLCQFWRKSIKKCDRESAHRRIHWHIQVRKSVFTALRGMHTRSRDENSVRLSVHLSVRLSVRLYVKRVICDKMEERSIQIFIPYERSFSIVSWEEEWLVGATPSTWNVGSTGPHWSELTDFQTIFARSASAVTPSESSSISTNRKSTTRFPMSLRWSSYVAPPPLGGRGSKT